MEQRIHQNIINHWLQYFQVNEKYSDICKDIPVLYLKSIDTEMVKEIKIKDDVFYIDKENQVFHSVFLNYGNNKEIVGHKIGECRDGKIYLDKK